MKEDELSLAYTGPTALVTMVFSLLSALAAETIGFSSLLWWWFAAMSVLLFCIAALSAFSFLFDLITWARRKARAALKREKSDE